MADQSDFAVPLSGSSPSHYGPEEGVDIVGKIRAHLHVGSKVSQPMYRYDMTHPRRGDLLVINNQVFKTMPTRPGADVDTQSLKNSFSSMGFNVIVGENLTCRQMRKLVKDAADKDHTDADCFCCIVLSHGEGNDVIHGTDAPMKLDLLFAPFKSCPSLLGKPKIFIIQACRGEDMDEGANIQSDGMTYQEGGGYKIPVEADFLYVYSSVAGYRSFRNPKVGSYFIRALCDNLNHYKNSRDIMWILTRVNYTLAYEFQSRAKSADIDKKKQVSSFVSMLTKELYLGAQSDLGLEDIV